MIDDELKQRFLGFFFCFFVVVFLSLGPISTCLGSVND